MPIFLSCCFVVDFRRPNGLSLASNLVPGSIQNWWHFWVRLFEQKVPAKSLLQNQRRRINQNASFFRRKSTTKYTAQYKFSLKKNRRDVRRRPARPKNSAAGGEKKIRPFGDQNLKENNRQKERGNRQTKHEQTTKTPKNGKCQFFQIKKTQTILSSSLCRRHTTPQQKSIR